MIDTDLTKIIPLQYKSYLVEEKEVNSQMIAVFYKNRFKIIMITGIFLLFGIAITLITPKKYQAAGVVYPTASNNIKDVAKNPEFGFEMHADKLIQLFSSQPMKDKIVSQFNLINYYELDTSSKDWRYKLNSKFAHDINFTRTKYLSVVVSAEMKDPFLAANIVNSMISYIDTIRRDIMFKNLYKLHASLTQKVMVKQQIVDSILSNIFEYNQKSSSNIISVNTSNKLSYKKSTGTSQSGDGIIQEALENNYSLDLEKQVNEYYIQLDQLNKLKYNLDDVNETLTLPFPSVYNVIRAEADERKASPSLVQNSFLALLSGLVFSLLLIVFSHNWAKFKTQFSQ